MTIYVSDELKARMDAADTNWSAVAQAAFDLELRSQPQKEMDMNAAVERLRASKEKAEQQDRPAWITAGREWAMRRAEHAELERVAGIDVDPFEESRALLTALVAAVLGHETARGVDRSEINNFCEEELGTFRPTLRQLAWWCEGAADVWSEVKDQL